MQRNLRHIYLDRTHQNQHFDTKCEGSCSKAATYRKIYHPIPQNLTHAKNFSAPLKAHQTVHFARVFLLLTSYFPFYRPRGTRKYQWSFVTWWGAREPPIVHQLFLCVACSLRVDATEQGSHWKCAYFLSLIVTLPNCGVLWTCGLLWTLWHCTVAAIDDDDDENDNDNFKQWTNENLRILSVIQCYNLAAILLYL